VHHRHGDQSHSAALPAVEQAGHQLVDALSDAGFGKRGAHQFAGALELDGFGQLDGGGQSFGLLCDGGKFAMKRLA